MYLNHQVIYMKISSLRWLEYWKILRRKSDVLLLLYFMSGLFMPSFPHCVVKGKRIRQLLAVNEKFSMLGWKLSIQFLCQKLRKNFLIPIRFSYFHHDIFFVHVKSKTNDFSYFSLIFHIFLHQAQAWLSTLNLKMVLSHQLNEDTIPCSHGTC